MTPLTTKAAEIRAGLVERLRGAASDPMWADHAEVSKRTLTQAAALIEQQAAELAARHERYSLDADEMLAVAGAIGSARFMDPPDGGDVSLAEQVKRMREALTTAEAERDELLREKERLAKLSDRYGVALMMIRAGCSQPQRFAGNILDDKEPVEIDLEDCDEDHR